MKTIVISICLVFLAFNIVEAREDNVNMEVSDSIFRDVTAMKQDIVSLKDKAKKTADKVGLLSKENLTLKKKVDSLSKLCTALSDSVVRNHAGLSKQIVATNDYVLTSEEELSSQLFSRTLWGVGFLGILLIAITATAYHYHKKISYGSASIDEVRKAQDSLQKAQTSLQKESIKLDNKLVELIEAQINPTTQKKRGSEPDHTLALKVADEIVRMELNLSRMDASVKGHKQLSKAVQRIKDNFKANGYDIVDMLGKPYNEGMKVVANFVSDENLEEGQQIISSITKPQINYNGQMIQAAQITVSQNI